MVQGTNISGCGIAIYSRQNLASGRMLELELLLDSGAVRLRAVGRVVSSETLRPREKGWLVRIDFVDIDTADEETLVQYVMRRQLRLLRREREAGLRP
jgi:c-di-GMP-binding flagellar brake protein YcgR